MQGVRPQYEGAYASLLEKAELSVATTKWATDTSAAEFRVADHARHGLRPKKLRDSPPDQSVRAAYWLDGAGTVILIRDMVDATVVEDDFRLVSDNSIRAVIFSVRERSPQLFRVEQTVVGEDGLVVCWMADGGRRGWQWETYAYDSDRRLESANECTEVVDEAQFRGEVAAGEIASTRWDFAYDGSRLTAVRRTGVGGWQGETVWQRRARS